MATINKNMIKPERSRFRKPIEKDMDLSSNYYNTEAWHRFRNYYVTTHPLCSICLDHHKMTPTEELHHKRRFMSGDTEDERWKLFLDPSNVVALCKCCHYGCHKHMRTHHVDCCYSLNDEEWAQAQSMYYNDKEYCTQ